jgi:hypothetical protein
MQIDQNHFELRNNGCGMAYFPALRSSQNLSASAGSTFHWLPTLWAIKRRLRTQFLIVHGRIPKRRAISFVLMAWSMAFSLSAIVSMLRSTEKNVGQGISHENYLTSDAFRFTSPRSAGMFQMRVTFFDRNPPEKTLYPATSANVLTTFSAGLRAGNS